MPKIRSRGLNTALTSQAMTDLSTRQSTKDRPDRFIKTVMMIVTGMPTEWLSRGCKIRLTTKESAIDALLLRSQGFSSVQSTNATNRMDQKGH